MRKPIPLRPSVLRVLDDCSKPPISARVVVIHGVTGALNPHCATR